MGRGIQIVKKKEPTLFKIGDDQERVNFGCGSLKNIPIKNQLTKNANKAIRLIGA